MSVDWGTVQGGLTIFFASAVLGWLTEGVCKLFQFYRFINRGFLIGPYRPIYSFGAVAITLLLTPFGAYPLAVFILAMSVCGPPEYLTS